MDDSRFDGIAKTLGAQAARRGALRLLTVIVLGLLGRSEANEVAAHNLLAKCKKIKDKKKRKKCLKKARAHNALHAVQEPQGCETPATCPDPPPGQLCAVKTCASGRCELAPKSAGAICRPQAGPCDLPESCGGVSLECPPDKLQPSGQGCDEAICFNVSMRQLARRCSGTSPICPPPPPPIDCSPYRCMGYFDGCPTQCQDDGDCVDGAYCSSTQCVFGAGNGAQCNRGRQCATGYCVDGVCCNSACAAPANATRSCAGGACGFTCLNGFGDCDGNLNNGCETDTNSNKQHCGGCGQVCAGPCAPGLIRLCEEGECVCS